MKDWMYHTHAHLLNNVSSRVLKFIHEDFSECFPLWTFILKEVSFLSDGMRLLEILLGYICNTTLVLPENIWNTKFYVALAKLWSFHSNFKWLLNDYDINLCTVPNNKKSIILIRCRLFPAARISNLVLYLSMKRFK